MKLFNKLIDYKNENIIPMHMPGHKRNIERFLDNSFEIDITEIDGFDNYHNPEGIIKEIQEAAAGVYGALESYFLVNGSTAGIMAAISASVNMNSTIAVARNCHKAVYNAIALRCLHPVYIYPQNVDKYGIFSRISPDDVDKLLTENDKIEAVVITSPTYEGIVSDIEQIAKVCHDKGVILIVDAAHGAHFEFDDTFPKAALRCGADIVIESVHKTLPSMTQTAIMHICGNLADRNRIRKYLGFYQSSSPSYVFMSCIDRCINYMISDEGKKTNKQYIKALSLLRSKLKALKNIHLLDYNKDVMFDYDISKLVLCSKNNGMKIYDMLRDDYGIQLEMGASNYCIAMTSIGDDFSWYDKLYDALYEIDGRLSEQDEVAVKLSEQEKTDSIVADLENEVVFDPYKIEDERYAGNGKLVDYQDAVGKVSLDAVFAYPPGIPIVYYGERISQASVLYISQCIDNNVNVIGFSNAKEKKILCIE